ncbi:MAG: DUF4178 domain-containing protein [Spirochaetes bacterium]|nr:DUF4178 domain-containing protein [Spirochaetota bacterium]
MSVQSDDALKEVGKTAALIEDGSPLQLGASGTLEGKTFTIIGRIQYNFGLGFWNEWYINMAEDAGGPAWLGEANGIYFYTRLKKDARLSDALEFDKLYAGGIVSIDGKEFYVKDIQTSKVVSGEGELPFPFESEYEAPVVDLVRQDGTLATLDFSEEKPLVFIGKAVKYKDLHMQRVRGVYGFKAADAEAQGAVA